MQSRQRMLQHHRVPRGALCTHNHLPPLVSTLMPGSPPPFLSFYFNSVMQMELSSLWHLGLSLSLGVIPSSLLCCCMDQNFGPFSSCEYPPVWLFHSLSGHLLAVGYLNCCQFGPITNKTGHSRRGFCVAKSFHFSLINAKSAIGGMVRLFHV